MTPADQWGSAFATDNNNVLATLNRCDPCLGNDDPGDARAGRPRLGIDMVEVVQPPNYVAAFDARTTFQQRFIVTGKRCHGLFAVCRLCDARWVESHREVARGGSPLPTRLDVHSEHLRHLPLVPSPARCQQ